MEKMMMKKQPVRTPLTDEARSAQQNLLRLWRLRRQEKGLTQADICRETGWSQGVVSHYLNGGISLNERAVLKFAKVLDVAPDEIWPGLLTPNCAIDDVIPPDVIRLARDIFQLAPEDRQVVLKIARKFAPTTVEE